MHYFAVNAMRSFFFDIKEFNLTNIPIPGHVDVFGHQVQTITGTNLTSIPLVCILVYLYIYISVCLLSTDLSSDS